LEVAAQVATITLDRPSRLNAATDQMVEEFIGCLDRTDHDEEVRVVVVTGAGRAFCAGADLADGAGTFDYSGRPDGGPHRDNGGRLSLRIFASRKPVIAAINGPAVGMGITMTLPMDVRLASRSARFGFVFARRGIVPEACSTWFLPRLVGISQAIRWTTKASLFGSEEALSAGLVSGVYDDKDLLPAASALAAEMAQSAPASVALTRQLMWQGLTAAHPRYSHWAESAALDQRGRSADAGEGVRAFLDKRPPAFTDPVDEALFDVFQGWPEPPAEPGV
jgi:enoyl-CoA hydratase/carnithine racemase